ncbi:MAG TPA: metal ABC transporter permease, partial [Planctomycetia bacterium]|nr:metal ABC transporter permease [Planctomycetia bacterium]
MSLLSYNATIVLAGAGLLGVGAGAVGTFAVLRRRALVGDVVAHAALPGLGLAYLAVGQKQMAALLAGAFLAGLVGLAFVALLVRWTRVREDAALGIVLSVFFGAGICLDAALQARGATGQAGLDNFILGKTAGILARDVVAIGSVSAVCVLAALFLRKEWTILAFDAGFARSQGWPTLALDLLLMTAIAAIAVVGLPTVAAGMMSSAAIR